MPADRFCPDSSGHSRRAVIVLLALLAITAATNPAREKHVAWRVRHWQETRAPSLAARAKQPAQPPAALTNGLVLRAEADRRTLYGNYFFFSTGTDNVDGRTVSLGFFGTVIAWPR